MKLLLFLFLYPALIIAPKSKTLDLYTEFNLKKRSILVNILINKFIAYIRHIITHGSMVVGVPPLDPYETEELHLIIPTGLFNLDLRLKNVSMIGIGGFIMHRNNLHLSNLTFEIEVSVPRVILSTEMMLLSELDNNFISAIPICSKDKTEVEMDKFRLQAVLKLKQSEDEKSILIDDIQDALFDIPSFKINSDGLIEDDNLDQFTEIQGFMDYVNGCKEAITKIIANAIITFGNPVLNQLDTWRYIAVLL